MIFSSHTRRKKTDLQFQITNIYYTKESPRNKEYDKYPYFKHVVKPQDDIVGYYPLDKISNISCKGKFTIGLISDDSKYPGY